MLKSQAVREFVSQAHIYDLGLPISPGIPTAPSHPRFTMTLHRRHGDIVLSNGFSHASELLIMSGHTGTHIDALGHVSCHNRCYGGRDAQDIQTGTAGLNELDIAAVSPIVSRGVLLDIPALKGVDVLPAGYAVTSDDLESAERRQDVAVEKGDAVLIRTGWVRYFDDAPRFLGADGGTPGPDVGAAHWLSDRKIRVTGDDTVIYEVSKRGQDGLPVHPALIVDAGIFIIELLNLEELARDQQYEFVFVCSPLRFVGGTGSPIRPLAMVL